MELIEKFVRRYARRTMQNGVVVLITDGDAMFLDAFKVLGWSDPYPDPTLLPHPPPPKEIVAAVVSAPERAVMPKAKGRYFGRS